MEQIFVVGSAVFAGWCLGVIAGILIFRSYFKKAEAAGKTPKWK